MMRVTVLGCGGSAGVPVIGGDWGKCDPANPKNRRSRASIHVAVDGVGLLVDTSPDLRQQLLDSGIAQIDAVLWTHNHADHCHGLDDLREICRLRGGALDAFGMEAHLKELRQRFDYAFEPLPKKVPVYRPVLNPRIIDGPFDVAGVAVVPFVQDHGWVETLGFRIGNFAYSTDVVRLNEVAFTALEGVEVWIVDCVREAPGHPVHSHLAQTLAWIERVQPKRAYLTHMNQSMDYEATRARLPPGVEPAYDGLMIDLD